MWVYFLLIDEQSIKIGATANLAKRIRQFEKTTLATHRVELLAAVESNRSAEKSVQRYFADDGVADLLPPDGRPPEVFQATRRLTDYVRWLRNQWFACVDVDDLPEGKVSFEQWQPTAKRFVPPPRLPLFEPDSLDFTMRVLTADDFYTPDAILYCVREVLGSIDLDPASHPLANKHVQAQRFFSIQENGLLQPWSGNVWINPPFSQWKQWVPKIIEEWNRGDIEQMCVLSAMRTVTAQYFASFLSAAYAMAIIKGRLQFGGLAGESPDDGHAVFYFGQRIPKFVKSFSSLGTVWLGQR